VLGAAGASVSCGSSDSSTGGSTDASSDAVTDAGGQETATDAGSDAADETQDTTPDVPDVPCIRRPFLVMRRGPKVDRRDEFATRGSAFHSTAEPRAGTIVERDDWSTSMPRSRETNENMHAPTRRALADAWREDGRQEHASIAAFARFTMLALAVG